MQTLRFFCRGVSPMLMDCINQAPRRDRVCTPGPRSAQEEAERRLFLDSGSVIALPNAILNKTIVDGWFVATRSPGKCRLSRSRREVESLLFTTDAFVPLTCADGTLGVEWKPDVRRARAGKQVTVLARPRFNNWGFFLNVTYDFQRLGSVTVEKVLEVAGRSVGLGARAPRHGGIFGRFEVSRCQMEKVA